MNAYLQLWCLKTDWSNRYYGRVNIFTARWSPLELHFALHCQLLSSLMHSYHWPLQRKNVWRSVPVTLDNANLYSGQWYNIPPEERIQNGSSLFIDAKTGFGQDALLNDAGLQQAIDLRYAYTSAPTLKEWAYYLDATSIHNIKLLHATRRVVWF